MSSYCPFPASECRQTAPSGYVHVEADMVRPDDVLWWDGRARVWSVTPLGHAVRIDFIRDHTRHGRVIGARDHVNVWR